MVKVFIGAGGWAYFQVPGTDPLKAYAQAFNFVEVNATFYSYPSLRQVKSWRNRTPADFHFAVRSYQELTHGYHLQPVPAAFQIYDRMRDICKILRATILHLQTPPSMEMTNEKIEGFRQFFNSVDTKSVRIAWEVRSFQGGRLNPRLTALMKDLGIVHCVDVSRETPAFESDILYTRLFGKGTHNLYQFDDEELKEISQRADRASSESYLSFHSVRMYTDAARLKVFREHRRFPRVTKSTGVDSLIEVFKEDARFPSTKGELIATQGWKVIDLGEDRRVHASTLLRELPEKVYSNLQDVKESLQLTRRIFP